MCLQAGMFNGRLNLAIYSNIEYVKGGSGESYTFFSFFRDVNNCIMELLIMAYGCRTSSAKSIVGVIPYMPYSKQCKMRKRGCIVSKLLAKLMVQAGLTHIITMDLHQKEIQGFFDCPVDNLRASPFLLEYITQSVRAIFIGFIEKVLFQIQLYESQYL